MIEVTLIIGAIVAIAVLATLAFFGWMAFVATRGVFRTIFGINSAPASATPALEDRTTCPHGGCHADNPAHANFCRRCGGGLRSMSSRGIRAA